MNPLSLALLALTAAAAPVTTVTTPAATPTPAAPAQSTSPDAFRSERPWRLFDRVEVIVNEEIVTVSEFDREFREFTRSTNIPATTQQEIQQASILVAQRKVDGLLAEQGGRDLGFDEAQVRRMVQNWEDNLIEEAGGVGQRSENLLAEGSAAHLERAQLTGDIYRISWERAITGRDAGPLGRPTKDRYVRPGQIHRLYDQASRMTGGLEQLGATVGAYRLQVLVLDVQELGGIDPTLERAEEVQRRLAAGESFDAMVEEFGAQKGQASLLRPLTSLELERIAELDDAWGELARWATDAATDTWSDSIYVGSRGSESVQIAKLLERPEPLTFDTVAAQSAMRRHTLEIRDNYHRGLALEDLKRSAYIWTPDYAPAEAPPEAGSAPATPAP